MLAEFIYKKEKSSDDICKSMFYDTEESWYIFIPFPRWYVITILCKPK